mgnify:FL=1
MTIITKGMGAVIKAAMKKAGVKKPTFPGPRSIELLNKRLKNRKGRYRQDIVESGSKMIGKPKRPGASFIELDARIKKGIR